VAAVSKNATILPSQITLTGLTTPPTTIDPQQQYFTKGTVTYNGSQQASLLLIATPVNGGTGIVVAVGRSLPGSFTLTWYPLQQLLSAGTTYTLTESATYNGVTASVTLPGTYSVPGSTSPTSFLSLTFLGLPLWLWLAIAGAAAVGIIAVLLVLRRAAAGKLVECGECGNLIPEEATVCPKCGAEFETDLVRCSRCAATIPSNSTICPECAAQLLGSPGEAPEEAERQGYQDFTEKYRAEGKKELGENYNEGSFWDWWKRQPTYVSYSQWKLQQGQGSPRTGMSEPPVAMAAATPPAPAPTPVARGAPPPVAPPPMTARPPPKAPPPTAGTAPTAPGGLKACPSCGKEIPGDYLVCPFCGSVTQ
jgi:RNA polymerase subunit RPABC4/transcription elongation factor Spt4